VVPEHFQTYQLLMLIVSWRNSLEFSVVFIRILFVHLDKCFSHLIDQRWPIQDHPLASVLAIQMNSIGTQLIVSYLFDAMLFDIRDLLQMNLLDFRWCACSHHRWIYTFRDVFSHFQKFTSLYQIDLDMKFWDQLPLEATYQLHLLSFGDLYCLFIASFGAACFQVHIN